MCAFEQSYEYLDIPQDAEHPVAWAVNVHPWPTDVHFDIHVGLEIGVVLSGKSRRHYEGHSFTAERGQVWFAGLWEPHGFEILRPNTRHLVLGFLPEFLGGGDACVPVDWLEIFRLPPARRPRLRTSDDRRQMLSVAERIQGLMEGNSRFVLARLRMLLQELLLHFMERGLAGQSRKSSEGFSRRQDILPALLLVEEDPGRKILLADAARAAHMSRSRFAAVFHRTIGVPFGKYLQRRRLAGTMQDLRSSSAKLLAIAERWGFSDAPHLVRSFKGATGLTPEEYRRHHHSDTSGQESGSLLTMPNVQTAAKTR